MAAATTTTTKKAPVKKTTKKTVEVAVPEIEEQAPAPAKEVKKATKKKALSAETVEDTGDEAEEKAEVKKEPKKKAAAPKTKKAAAPKKPAAKKAATAKKPRAKKTVKAEVVESDVEEHEDEQSEGEDEELEPVDVKVTRMRRPRKIKGCEAYTDEKGRAIPARKIAFSNLYLAYVVKRKEAVDMEKMTPLILTDWDGRKAAKSATKQHLLDNNLMTGKRDVYLLEVFDHLSSGNKKRIATHAYSVRYTLQHKTKTIVNKKATFNRDVVADPKRIPADNLLAFQKACMRASQEYEEEAVEAHQLKNKTFADLGEESDAEEEVTVEEFEKIVKDREEAAKAAEPEAER